MASWLGNIKEILGSVLDEYAVRLAIFVITWPLIHLLLQLPIFGFISALNIPVIDSHSIQAKSLLSFGVALLIQNWIGNLIQGQRQKAQEAKWNNALLGDIQQNESAFLLVLHQERVNEISRDFRINPKFKKAINYLFKDDSDQYDRTLLRLSTTRFMYHEGGQYTRLGPHYGAYLDDIGAHREALKAHAGKMFIKAKSLIE